MKPASNTPNRKANRMRDDIAVSMMAEPSSSRVLLLFRTSLTTGSNIRGSIDRIVITAPSSWSRIREA